MTATEPVAFDLPARFRPTLEAIRDHRLTQHPTFGRWSLDGQLVDSADGDIGTAVFQTSGAVGLIEHDPEIGYRLTAGGEAALRTGTVVAEGQVAAMLAGWGWPVRDRRVAS